MSAENIQLLVSEALRRWAHENNCEPVLPDCQLQSIVEMVSTFYERQIGVPFFNLTEFSEYVFKVVTVYANEALRLSSRPALHG